MTTYVFEGFELDTRRHELRHQGALVAVEPQVFSVLAYLAAHADRVVGKDELLDAVWQTRFVTESALTSRILSMGMPSTSLVIMAKAVW